MNRVSFVIPAAVLLAVLVFGGWLVQANWYEYHVLDNGETPQEIVNQGGWEPVPGAPARSGTGFVLNYRRARWLPHGDVAAPVPTVVPSPRASAIHSKTAKLAQDMRWIVQYSGSNSSLDVDMRKTYYADSQTAYSELAAEIDGDNSAQGDAVRALLPQIKGALETAKKTVNNDALIRLAVQLDHAS